LDELLQEMLAVEREADEIVRRSREEADQIVAEARRRAAEIQTRGQEEVRDAAARLKDEKVNAARKERDRRIQEADARLAAEEEALKRNLDPAAMWLQDVLAGEDLDADAPPQPGLTGADVRTS